ncbi:DegT/DnrJ/EryC1/StrS family aminotransferase [Marinilabiliaceae bacterium ANBcel2]|nr:DegT/DnrJ/EryC1/StrS family aminotransferase [Marinilabiliaceae bacterium ANBcel2]
MHIVDLQNQYYKIKDKIDAAVADVINSGAYINGKAVNDFCDNLSCYLRSSYVVPCGNGTDALMLALMALELKPGDEVITSPFSFAASAEAISFLGLKPVFADINPHTFNIDAEAVEELITPKTAAIMPVHLFGLPSDMEKLVKLAKKRSIYLIEDVAQALGAKCKIGNKIQFAGTIGDIGCTSFFPSKNLGCFGDGGACITENPDIAETIKIIASHGSSKKYLHSRIGVNSRLDTLQAAVLNVKLPYLDDYIEKRRRQANIYNNILKGCDYVVTPYQPDNLYHTYNQYTIKVDVSKRDMLKDHLASKGIPSRIYYPLSLNRQPAYKNFIDKRSFNMPVAEEMCKRVLSLPVDTEKSDEVIEFIANEVVNFFN